MSLFSRLKFKNLTFLHVLLLVPIYNVIVLNSSLHTFRTTLEGVIILKTQEEKTSPLFQVADLSSTQSGIYETRELTAVSFLEFQGP